MDSKESLKKILIVDDERTLHVMCRPVFEMNGFEFFSAYTGEDGLNMALEKLPDLIVLDVIMPKMKGRDVCKKLKDDPRTRNIPVLFLTAKDSDEDLEAERSVGAVGHITKPINPAHLVKRIREVLRAEGAS